MMIAAPGMDLNAEWLTVVIQTFTSVLTDNDNVLNYTKHIMCLNRGVFVSTTS